MDLNDGGSSRSRVKKHIIEKNLIEYRCALCGIDKWGDDYISLHLDHINGIGNDNRLENLRFLCPNCHSQTETYAGRKNKVKYSVKVNKVTDEEILHAMQKEDKPSKVLSSVGLAGGANYQRVYKLAEKFNIEKHFSIKKVNAIRVKKLREANVDNSKFGWINKVADIICICPQKVRYWLDKNYPGLLEDSFLRNSF